MATMIADRQRFRPWGRVRPFEVTVQMPMRANIVGPPRVATRIKASTTPLQRESSSPQCWGKKSHPEVCSFWRRDANKAKKPPIIAALIGRSERI
jgi:hypothetical protein